MRCSQTVYDGNHEVGKHGYILISPDGTYRQFCDSDCLRETLIAEHEEFLHVPLAQR